MSDGVEQVPEEDWRVWGPADLTQLDRTLLDCFVRSGYHGATTRMLAHATGLSVPGLYHHYPSKHAMLERLMSAGMNELYSRTVAALASVGDSPLDQLHVFVECLVLFHAHRGDLAFLSTSELRSLEAPARATQIEARHRQQSMLDDLIDRGIAEGVFNSPDPHDTSRAITTMCVAVAQWYRADGPHSPERIARLYATLAERMLGTAEQGLDVEPARRDAALA